jgi:hypothetical protein
MEAPSAAEIILAAREDLIPSLPARIRQPPFF